MARLFRDPDVFASSAESLGELFDPELESVPAWQGDVLPHIGVEGFREMWLDWLEPWAGYHVHVEEVVDAGERVAVFVRDRARRHDRDAEVELISGSVWTLREGRIRRVVFYGSREDVLDATGLRPSG